MTIQYNSNFEGTMPFSDTTIQLKLSITETTYTVPGTDLDTYQAIFSYDDISDVFVSKNVEATYPMDSEDITELPYVDYKPAKRFVVGGDVLHFVTPSDSSVYMGVSFSKIPS